MASYFDYYNSFYGELAKIDAEGNTFEKISDLLPDLRPNSKILDIGAGYGTVSSELICRGHEVWALEANSDAVGVLLAKGFVAVCQDISESIELHERFDLILLLDVLEHVFDPVHLLLQAQKHLKTGGQVLISVPLYFDIIDRLRILFTGSIISYDNQCYGPALYARFRSYNYDHIRFFRPIEIHEMASIARLKVTRITYGAIPIYWRLPRPIRYLVTHKKIIRRWPDLFAHSARAVLVGS